MKAVILAAGASKRLHPAMVDLPKCLLDINGSTLLDHQLGTIRSLDIREIILVVGFKQEAIKSVIKERWSSLNVRYIENSDFAATNTIYSLWLVRDFLKDDFLYFNADVLCHKDVAKSNAAYSVDISDSPFIEIDFPEDLETARNVVAKELFG